MVVISIYLEVLYLKGGSTIKASLMYVGWALHTVPCFIFTAEAPIVTAVELYGPPQDSQLASVRKPM